jgi:DNA-binding protein YbaB
MLDKLKQLSDLKRIRDQAQALQKKLSEVLVEVRRGRVHVIMSADQKIHTLTISGQEDEEVKETINEAIKKSQEAAASEMQGMMGGLGGLLGK